MGLETEDYVWLESWFKVLNSKLDLILKTLNKDFQIMTKEIDNLAAQVTAMESAEASAITLLSELATQIAANANDPAAINAIAAKLKTDAASLAAAVVANTPAAPTSTTPAGSSPGGTT